MPETKEIKTVWVVFEVDGQTVAAPMEIDKRHLDAMFDIIFGYGRFVVLGGNF